jgi:hypothetical protein
MLYPLGQSELLTANVPGIFGHGNPSSLQLAIRIIIGKIFYTFTIIYIYYYIYTVIPSRNWSCDQKLPLALVAPGVSPQCAEGIPEFRGGQGLASQMGNPSWYGNSSVCR